MEMTKTTHSGQVEKADTMSARLLIASEKLAQAVDESPKRLKACAETYGRQTSTASDDNRT